MRRAAPEEYYRVVKKFLWWPTVPMMEEEMRWWEVAYVVQLCKRRDLIFQHNYYRWDWYWTTEKQYKAFVRDGTIPRRSR